MLLTIISWHVVSQNAIVMVRQIIKLYYNQISSENNYAKSKEKRKEKMVAGCTR